VGKHGEVIMMGLSVDWSLYLLLDMGALGGRDPLEIARAALASGVSVVQLRAKGWTAREQVALCQQLLPLVRVHRVPLIVNDHADIALAVGADGVHLGVDDVPVALARRIMPHGIIGYSPADVLDAQRAVGEGVDYLGVGPFAATRTKHDAGTPIGAAGIALIARAVGIPVLAIGGITVATVSDVLAAGAAGIVVGAAITGAPDPAAAARALHRAVASAPTGGLAKEGRAGGDRCHDGRAVGCSHEERGGVGR